MTEFDLFPKQGENIIGASLWFQKNLIGLSGCGVLKDLELTRVSASSVSVSSGYYAYFGVAKDHVGATLSAIPAASSGMHRYDLVVLDALTGIIERLEGTESVPDDLNNFLENYLPLPAALTFPHQIVLGILWIGSSGIKTSSKGTYCTNGIASIRAPTIFGVDNDTIIISAEGILSADIAAVGGGDLLANGSVPLTANWDVGSFQIRALTFESDATTVAPFTVASTSVVTNLNADLLDGSHSTAFLKTDGSVALTAGWDAGSYQVRALTFYADATTGAPLTIGSTTVVTNLNADLLDGLEASAFLKKDGSITLTADWDAGSYQIRALTFYADATTGAPLTIGSTTVVSNLNADLLDGSHSTAFLKTDGSVALSANWDVGDYLITALRFASDTTTVAPFTVASTTVVTSLNADLLDGLEAAAFLKKDATIALTADWDVGSFQVRALTFYADTTTVAPFTVASTTVVSNLNADLLDGSHSTAFLKTDGSVALSANWDIGDYTITALRFASDTTTVSPFTVVSTTKVTNLNADLLDGLEDTAFLKHSLATAENDFLVASGSGTFAKKTLAETKTILGVGSGGAAFWTTFPGTPTRISDTSFSVTDTSNANYYDLMFSAGTIIKWEKSGGGFQTAKIVSSSYSANAVTYTIVGNTLATGFTTMKYCLHRVEEGVFIVPGVLPGNTATSDIAKTIYAEADILIFSALVRYRTAATTTKGVWDINDDGVTIFTTKPEIAASATVGTQTACDCLAASSGTALTVVAKDSVITLDYDSGHATTPGADAYVIIYYMPASWRYIS